MLHYIDGERAILANYIEVLTAESSLLANERAAAQVLEHRLLTTTQVIQALGGGWRDSRIYAVNLSKTASDSISR